MKSHRTPGHHGTGARSGSIFSGGASSSVPWFSLLSTILSQGYSKILLYFPHPWFQRGFGLLQKPHVKPDSDFVGLELTTLWWSFLSLGSRNWMGKILVAVGFGCFTPPTSLKIVLSPEKWRALEMLIPMQSKTHKGLLASPRLKLSFTIWEELKCCRHPNSQILKSLI